MSRVSPFLVHVSRCFYIQFDLSAITDKMAEMEGDEDVPKIKLGDASCAAPFTSKLSHVSASELATVQNVQTANDRL